MIDPAAKAQWVLAVKGIADIPAPSLQAIADSEGIKFKQNIYPDAWDGMLIFKGDRRALLVNTRIGNTGRHNFTFAHELGHHFLAHSPSYSGDGQLSIRCILSDVDTIRKGREAEANRFAAALLMPETLFQPLTAGSPFDFTLIKSLAITFQVSKHACSYRILDFIREPHAVVFSKGLAVTACKVSQAARGGLRDLKAIPEGTAAYAAIFEKKNQPDFTEGEPQKWLARVGSGAKLYECTHGSFDNGVAMTILRW